MIFSISNTMFILLSLLDHNPMLVFIVLPWQPSDVDILEEFAFIRTLEGGNVTLDVLPVSTSAIAQ